MTSKEALNILKQILGNDLYKQVLEQMAGATVYFPTASNADWVNKEQRNLCLKEDFYSGKYEVSDLARKYELSISHVYKIIQGRA